jgi:uncharacterized membrane protein SirB2
LGSIKFSEILEYLSDEQLLKKDSAPRSESSHVSIVPSLSDCICFLSGITEMFCWFQAQHPNIVTVREIVVGSNMDKIFIVMDYVEHDLKSLMETMKQKKQVFIPGNGIFGVLFYK